MTQTELTPADAAVVQRLGALDACAVSDALDTLGLPGAVVGVRPLWPVDRVVAGRVRTIQAAPKTEGQAGTHIASPLIAVAAEGDVAVIANGGREDVSCFGGILAVAAVARGMAGVVIDGACRDIAESDELGLPVFGRAVVPVSARGRIVQTAMDEAIEFAGVTVRSGDYVVADRSGVVFVPTAEAGRVLELAERIAARESAMVEAVRAGESVVDVMHDSRFPQAEDGR
jgi:regulator of RNase E activity RraA